MEKKRIKTEDHNERNQFAFLSQAVQVSVVAKAGDERDNVLLYVKSKRKASLIVYDVLRP